MRTSTSPPPSSSTQAADISEQISTAGKEAKRDRLHEIHDERRCYTCTLDGANIEIREAVGDDNIFIFGLTAEEVMRYYCSGGYISYDVMLEDSRLKLLCDQLKNGFYRGYEFSHISDALFGATTSILSSGISTPMWPRGKDGGRIRGTSRHWAEMSLQNIARSGRFSSDRAISRILRRNLADKMRHLLSRAADSDKTYPATINRSVQPMRKKRMHCHAAGRRPGLEAWRADKEQRPNRPWYSAGSTESSTSRCPTASIPVSTRSAC